MSLASGVADLATGIAAYLKSKVLPRLLPAGGAANQVLIKSSATDFAAGWSSPPYLFGFPCADKPLAGESIGPFVADRPFTLPAGLATSIATAGTAATATAVFSLRKNGVEIAKVTFAAGSTTGQFSMDADVAIIRSDRLVLVAPATQDATLADIGFTFVGSR